MALYYLNIDGSVSKKKKQGKEYQLQEDGSIKQINLPTNNASTNQKFQDLVKEREKQINLPAISEVKPAPFQLPTRTSNNPNNMEQVNQRLNNLKNYSKNKEIQDLVKESQGESLGSKIINGIKGVYNDSYLKDGYQFGDLLRTSLSTKKNIATNALHGLGKSLENFYDFSLNASTNINTALNEKLGIQTKEQAEQERKNTANIIKRDLTTDAENAIGFDEEAKKRWENGSLVRRDNLGGKVAQGVGEMAPQLLIGNALGGTETQWKALNFGKKLVASAPTNLGIGITSYGGGLEEAYSEGATTSQANKFALGSALVEMGTEWLTDGVPGLPQTGVFDKWTDKAVDKASNSMSKFLLKQGFTFLGEGGEEGLSEIIKPYLQNATYTSGRKVNWNDVFESFVIGGLVGDILELPGNLSNYHADVNVLKEEFNNELARENTSTNINIPTVENTSQNGLNVPINESINTNQNIDVDTNTNIDTNIATDEDINPLENIEEFKAKQKEIKNQQAQEETNNKIDNLTKQVEELNKKTDDIFSQQVDEVLKGTYPQRDMLIVSKNTPKILQNLGLNDLPITMTQKHLKTIVNSKGEYQNVNYHGLGVDIVKQLPNAISKPLNVLQSDTEPNSIVVITELADKQDRPVIASIKIDGTGRINDVFIDSNVMTSAYGRNNYDEFMKRNIAKGNLLYDIDEGIIKKSSAGGRLQLPTINKAMDRVQIPMQGNSISYDNNTTNRTKSQTATLPSKNNMQQNKKKIPAKSNKSKSNDKVSMSMAKTDDVIKVASKNIAKQINDTGGFDLKQRSWVETATESDVLKDKVYIDDLDQGMIKYVVQSNKKSLDTANNHLDTYGYDKSLDYVKNIMQSDKLPSASDVALMQRMIQEASKRGDYETVQELIMDTAIVGTDLGQATQALSIIQKLTPEGQLKMYTKLVQRAKARGEKSFQNVEITPEMVQNILEAYDKNGTYDQDDLNARVEKFKQDIADQMKTTTGEKIDAWRYLSMLGNPKTHIRNMVSNIAMTGTIKVKNAMARTLESMLPVKERTKTWKKSSDEIKSYAKQTAEDMKGIITGENKYNEKSAIESKKQIFKNKTLEKISNFNGNALEAEDWFFSKRAFQSTLEEYLTANGINTREDIQNNPELVEKAKLYAVEQAEIATFRQYSRLASMINQFERKGKVGKVAVEALMPFKKTPINVAKAGVNYSPVGLLKAVSYDAYQLKQGNINASQFIDRLSQGLTGTSLTLLGYALAKAGILSGSGGDDKEDKYDQQLGNTGYSLNIGGHSYSISWLSPVAMPLLVGSNAYEQLEEDKEWDMNVVSDTLAKTLDPLNEMSFMQGLTNALQSYGSGTDKIKGALESTGQNYVGQFFPTLFSQIASTTDDKKRSTKASNNSKYKFGEQTVRSVMYKIPGLRQQLEVATDIWGNEKEQSSNILERAFESFLAPYSKTKNISTDLDKEIKRVYNETGEKGVIPGIPYAYTKYNGETYRMSANEYTKFKKTYGQTANDTLNRLINSNDYKQATDEDKAKMIDNVYDYARAKANQEYFDSNDIDYSNQLLDKLDTLNDKYGISDNTYFANKNEYDYAYQSPDKYSVIKQIASYDKYNTYKNKITEIRNNTTNDKAETIKYINSLNMSIPQKAMFIKQYYKSFKSYDKDIIKYINSQKLTVKEKEQILTQLGFTVKDGRVY